MLIKAKTVFLWQGNLVVPGSHFEVDVTAGENLIRMNAAVRMDENATQSAEKVKVEEVSTIGNEAPEGSEESKTDVIEEAPEGSEDAPVYTTDMSASDLREAMKACGYPVTARMTKREMVDTLNGDALPEPIIQDVITE